MNAVGTLMSEGEISLLEAFHNTFLYFIQELNVLTWDAAKKWEWTGRWPCIAGEIQWEMRGYVEYILKHAGTFLAEPERTKIALFMDKMENLPPDALLAGQDTLNHPQWESLRNDARDLLECLARQISENHSFLNDV